MTWINSDGLIVKMGAEEGVETNVGEFTTYGPNRITTAVINFTEIASATPAVLGVATGALGSTLPQGARIEEVEIVVETAFTSSGTIGSATFLLGLVDLDRTTEEDFDGFTAAAATGTVLGLATVGTKTVLRKSSTGAGAFLGANLPDAGYLCVSNSAHGSHPLTAGRLIARIMWRPSQA